MGEQQIKKAFPEKITFELSLEGSLNFIVLQKEKAT